MAARVVQVLTGLFWLGLLASRPATQSSNQTSGSPRRGWRGPGHKPINQVCLSLSEGLENHQEIRKMTISTSTYQLVILSGRGEDLFPIINPSTTNDVNQPSTTTTPSTSLFKSTLPILNKPIIEHGLDWLLDLSPSLNGSWKIPLLVLQL